MKQLEGPEFRPLHLIPKFLTTNHSISNNYTTMKNIRVFIERAGDGQYSAYMPDDNGIPFNAIGEGTTAKEAHDDFLAVVDAFREDFPDVIPGLQFSFSYDMASFLAYYSGKLTLAGLSRITGVAQGQLSHYITGRRNPSPRTIAKINTALNSFGSELRDVSFV